LFISEKIHAIITVTFYSRWFCNIYFPWDLTDYDGRVVNILSQCLVVRTSKFKSYVYAID